MCTRFSDTTNYTRHYKYNVLESYRKSMKITSELYVKRNELFLRRRKTNNATEFPMKSDIKSSRCTFRSSRVDGLYFSHRNVVLNFLSSYDLNFEKNVYANWSVERSDTWSTKIILEDQDVHKTCKRILFVSKVLLFYDEIPKLNI